MVREVGKRLKNHHSAVGKQIFLIHCSEYAFKGIESCNILIEIFKDKQWGECNYGQCQIS
ncbi:hypothetical protein Glove_10g4 [Diversispora epigaea]|uniref:Uncharacterized protein n=1 Tax=Diversispora epigaea TaxID=1348612 RepID=A0A397JPE9_9GLOM|nr:hypothetical protein Glove_10g4 [Diversispora epigaea]